MRFLHWRFSAEIQYVWKLNPRLFKPIPMLFKRFHKLSLNWVENLMWCCFPRTKNRWNNGNKLFEKLRFHTFLLGWMQYVHQKQCESFIRIRLGLELTIIFLCPICVFCPQDIFPLFWLLKITSENLSRAYIPLTSSGRCT